ncbi:MAG: GYDIA family GHMP kinase [Owenweeksia sp.]|nr:GYDIA family GHMP kinase [Owenweeksia sp.]
MTGQRYFAHGKLLLTGEYLVLRGTPALALPTQMGQSVMVKPATEGIDWRSQDHQGRTWLHIKFSTDLKIIKSTDAEGSIFLQKLLVAGQRLRGEPLPACQIVSQLEFPRNWGLGSSSSLTYLVAQWLQVEPFQLFFATQDGSGYDIACAQAKLPLLYQLHRQKPSWQSVSLPACYYDSFFVYLGQKQHSQREVKKFNQLKVSAHQQSAIANLTHAFLKVNNAKELGNLMEEHEDIMSGVLQRPAVKESLFSDFKGAVKSLGAWGGDFVMALGKDAPSYFQNKGYPEVFTFRQMAHEKPAD